MSTTHRPPTDTETVPELVHAAAAAYGDREALADDVRSFSFFDVEREVERVGRALVASGIEPGERVAIWAPNGVLWPLAALGAYAARAVLVPINTRFKATEAGDVLRRAGARLLFTVGDFLGTDYVEVVRGIDGLDALAQIVVLDGPVGDGAIGWDEFCGRADDVDGAAVREREEALGPGDVSDVIFTSGTTGQPKGVVLAHGASIRAYVSWSEHLGLRADDRFLVVFPYFQTSGLKSGILACLLRGAANIPQPVFDVADVVRRVALHRVTVLPGAPTVFQSLIAATAGAGAGSSTLRLAITGGAATPVDVVRRIRDELGIEGVVTGYGLSETTGLVSMCRHDDPLELIANSVGRAVPGVEVRVVGGDGAALEPGAAGEILVRGYNVMAGYLDDPEATSAAIDRDGWLRTGDIGTLDAGGVLRITDRLKDMFIVGGFNVFPAEVENALMERDDVAHAAVIGMPDDRLGEVGAAFVVARSGETIDPDDVVAWCRERLANYKVPRLVRVVDALPMNASGKVTKFALRDQLV